MAQVFWGQSQFTKRWHVLDDEYSSACGKMTSPTVVDAKERPGEGETCAACVIFADARRHNHAPAKRGELTERQRAAIELGKMRRKKAVELATHGENAVEISRKLGVRPETVSRFIRQAGEPDRFERHKQRINIVKELICSGYSRQAIARKLSLSYKSVDYIIEKVKAMSCEAKA
jgi:DNA-binding NarL/FixJ family response regulator